MNLLASDVFIEHINNLVLLKTGFEWYYFSTTGLWITPIEKVAKVTSHSRSLCKACAWPS